jgi:hypothetical protein
VYQFSKKKLYLYRVALYFLIFVKNFIFIVTIMITGDLLVNVKLKKN